MKKLLYVYLLFIFMSSCINEDPEHVKDLSHGINETILVERDPNSPLILYKDLKNKVTKASRAELPLQDHLGYSYKYKTLPLGSGENVFYPVIDLAKMEKDYPSYVTEKRIGETKAQRFSYSTFERYTSKSEISKKVKNGPSLNLGLFSIGAKRTLEEVFSSSSVAETNSVFGELNATLKYSICRIQYSTFIINRIKLNYLHKTFIEEVYNTHPAELISNYGGFVLFAFYTGGAINAIYHGNSINNESAENKESNMNTDIEASFGFKVGSNDGKFTGDFGIGKNYSSGATSSNKIQNLQTSVRAIGGNFVGVSFTIPKDINDINVDFSSWVSSVNDVKNHNIIELADEGLVPIKDFIMEENIVAHMEYYYKNPNSGDRSFYEPCIEIICLEKSNNTAGFVINVCLHTRFGDHVMLETIQTSDPSESNAQAVVNQIKNKYAAITGLKIKQLSSSSMSDLLELFKWFCGVNMPDLSKMKKFVDTKRSVMYLLDTNAKTGFSIHFDYLLDTYAIRKLYNNCSSISVTDDELLTYRLVAL